jgi:uncharacterized membrane protein
MEDAELLQRLDGFDTRLVRLEELLGFRRAPVAEQPKSMVDPKPKQKLVKQLWASPATTAAEPYQLATSEELIESSPSEPPPIPVMGYQQPLPVAPINQPGLEQTIGLKWAGWVGAVVLVIGAALGIKYAYDQGWFLAIPTTVRVALMALGGCALIAAGEWVYRRVNVLSAAGLFGAGVAVLFVVSYAGFEYYGLYLRNTAFVFMGLCTLIGAVIARRGNMVSIAVLSLIGGNLAPVLLRSDTPQLPGLLVYVLMLQGVSLALARWGGHPKWWTLRGLSLATTALWVAAVLNVPPRSLLTTFTVVYAALYQFELVTSAIKSKLTIEKAGATFSLLVTAALSAGLLAMLDGPQNQMLRLVCMLGMAVIAETAAVFCRRLKDRHPALLELGTGYAIQALALVVVAVPVAFSGVWISAAWGVLAIALAVMGHVLELPLARYAAPGVWLLAVGELSLWTMQFNQGPVHQPLATQITGIDFTKTTVMGWGLALLGQIIATLIGKRRLNSPTETAIKLGLALSLCSTGLWLAASMLGLPPMPATAFIFILAGLLAAADSLDRDLQWLLQASVVAVLATVKWAVMDTLGQRVFGHPMPESLLFSVSGFADVCLLLCLAIIYHRATQTRESNPYSSTIRKTIGGLAIAVFFWLGTFGIDQAFINMRAAPAAMFTDPGRAEQVVLSIYWSVFALASIAGGFGWRIATLRYVGLGLFAVTLLKVVTIDLSQVSTGYRILSFMGLGVLLLGTSVLYGKVSPLLLDGANKGVNKGLNKGIDHESGG